MNQLHEYLPANLLEKANRISKMIEALQLSSVVDSALQVVAIARCMSNGDEVVPHADMEATLKWASETMGNSDLTLLLLVLKGKAHLFHDNASGEMMFRLSDDGRKSAEEIVGMAKTSPSHSPARAVSCEEGDAK